MTKYIYATLTHSLVPPTGLTVLGSRMVLLENHQHPELNGHVAAMDTRGFWREPQYSADSAQCYHYWWNAETHALIGQAMATGMLKAGLLG